MAIISCHGCSKSISDKATVCPHCDVSLSSEQQAKSASQTKIDRIKTIQSIQFQTMLALLLSIAGFVFYYWDGLDDPQMHKLIGLSAIGLGLIWYLINRIRISYLVRKYKK